MQTKPTAGDVILSVEHVTKTYPGVVALNDVSLTFERGEIHALLGENGAGKSTLMKVLSGSTTPDSGTFTIDGQAFSRVTPRQAMDAGLSIIYQELNLVPDLSVAENVFLGDPIRKGMLVDIQAMEKETARLFAELEINVNPRVQAGFLSTAQMQFVEIARAVRKDVKILVMDEPTSPLTNKDVQVLFRLVRRLQEKGVTILYVSHRLTEIYELSNRLTVLRDGQVIATRNTRDTTQDELIRLMVGRSLTETYPPRSTVPGDVVLECRNLTGNGVHDLSFTLRRGEILGVAGLVGSGRTETARMLFGADRPKSGEILIEGEPAAIRSPREAIGLGIGLLPEDRKLQGVLLERSVQENISLSVLKRISRGLLLNEEREAAIVNEYSNALQIKTPSLDQLVRNLSGGNQQKVALAKWLASASRILIFDEPTRGIDVGAKYEIYQMMNALSAQGIAILMISSEMEELLGMADRIVVLHEGRLTGSIESREEFSQERVMAYASSAV